jgi:hypothetical protein
MDNWFRHEWSKELERLRPRSLLRRGEMLWKRLETPWRRLTASLTELLPVSPSAGHHTHYCEECDRQWAHGGRVCAVPWAAPCADGGHEGAGTARSRLGPWFVVVRRDRPELCEQLTESFGDDPRITVVLDRRQLERRGAPASRPAVRSERRRGGDRRTPATSRDGQVWETLGFRPHRGRSPRPR